MYLLQAPCIAFSRKRGHLWKAKLLKALFFFVGGGGGEEKGIAIEDHLLAKLYTMEVVRKITTYLETLHSDALLFP